MLYSPRTAALAPIRETAAMLNTLLRQRRKIGICVGIALGVILVSALIYPKRSSLVAKGPMNTGHETLACDQCHIPVNATPAQQVSANIYRLLGLRRNSIGFGSKLVESAECVDCHDRPDDRHPISRFLEPHFAEARRHIKVYECAACHAEHQGKRVTLPTIGYCVHCHQDTAIHDDPILPTHADLVQNDDWQTCLQCHDFHGNHIRDTPVRLQDGISESAIWQYFNGETDSPYSDEKRHKARQSRQDTADDTADQEANPQ